MTSIYMSFKKMKYGILLCIVILSMTFISGCGVRQTKTSEASYTETTEADQSRVPETISYRFASKDEGKDLMLSNKDYYNSFNQNDLDYRMQKKNSTMDEFLAFAKDQVLDFTDEEKALIDKQIGDMEKTFYKKGYSLPPVDEIVFIKTTMKEECNAAGYTHGSQIYIKGSILNLAVSGDKEVKAEKQARLNELIWHELFHCLTRNNKDFRDKMYQLIHFTVADKDFTLPPGVYKHHITNPDVEHHNSYATFKINGQDKDCFVDFVTEKPFEKPGVSFFDAGNTALIPIDGTDIYYTPEMADNFYQVFGENTGYVIDPEECLADNFSYALLYGMDGPGGFGYPNPEIIEGILSYLQAERQ